MQLQSLVPHHKELKTGKSIRLSEAERLHHDAIEHLNVDPLHFCNSSTEKTFIEEIIICKFTR